VAQSTVGRILRGEVDPQSDNVERLARAFGLTYSALAALAEEEDPTRLRAQGGPSQRPPRGVPLLGWVPATGAALDLSARPPAHVTDWIACPRRPRGPRTVAFKVSGDSMAPEDPDVAAVQGHDVVVVLPDRNDVVFKRLGVQRRRRSLRALHPSGAGQVIPVSKATRIWGVVVGTYTDR
jgi:SOS-response transcriptional repressor LexA